MLRHIVSSPITWVPGSRGSSCRPFHLVECVVRDPWSLSVIAATTYWEFTLCQTHYKLDHISFSPESVASRCYLFAMSYVSQRSKPVSDPSTMQWGLRILSIQHSTWHRLDAQYHFLGWRLNNNWSVGIIVPILQMRKWIGIGLNSRSSGCLEHISNLVKELLPCEWQHGAPGNL